MKRLVLILALIVTVFVVNAQQTPEQAAKLEADNGVMNIKLNTLKSEFSFLAELNQIRKDTIFGLLANPKCGERFYGYYKTNFNVAYLLLNPNEVPSFYFLFIDEKLLGIQIAFHTRRQFLEGVINLIRDYGRPTNDRWTTNTFSIIIDSKNSTLYCITNGLKVQCNSSKSETNK